MAGIIFGAIAIRWITADFEVIFGYDAWWFFRHTQEIYDNNFIAPQWDTLSHFPPGRPVDYNLGWSYTIAIFYAMVHPLFPALTLMKFAGLFVTVFAALSAIPAYLLGRMITNRWGGLVAATCAVIPFAFLSVSVAGYPDSDSAVVFYSFLAILTTFYAVRKANKLNFENAKIFFKSFGMYLPYLAPALLAFWLFSLNWKYAFYIYFILLFFIPLLILFRFLEGKILLHERGYLSLVYQKIVQNRNAIFTIVLLGLFGEAISLVTSGSPYNARPLYDQVIIGLAVTRLDILGILIFSTLFTLIGAIIGSSIGRLKG
ncbi:MAG: STT3 domain-containing protein, partial [Nitrososphaerales archaeon]